MVTKRKAKQLWLLSLLPFAKVACWMRESSPRRSCSLQTCSGLPSQTQDDAPDHGRIQIGGLLLLLFMSNLGPWPSTLQTCYH